MKMNEVKSSTWTKIAEISTDDFSIDGIARARIEEFDEQFVEDVFDDIENAIADGYIQICDDGIILWGSWKEV